MKLIPNAKSAGRLWSVRLAVLSAALGAAEASLHLWEGVVPDGVFAMMASLIGMAAAAARVVHQEGFS